MPDKTRIGADDRPAGRRHLGLRALAVDDNAVNREVLMEALSSLGIRVDMAADGAEAVEAAARTRYDIVFMDCSMPGMDGFEATRRIRGNEGAGPHVRIVALTAHVDGSAASRWRDAGMDSHVAKPFELADLEREAAAALMGEDRNAVEGSGPKRLSEESTTALVAGDTLRMFDAVSGGNALAARIFGMFEQHARSAFADLCTLADSQAPCATRRMR